AREPVRVAGRPRAARAMPSDGASLHRRADRAEPYRRRPAAPTLRSHTGVRRRAPPSDTTNRGATTMNGAARARRRYARRQEAFERQGKREDERKEPRTMFTTRLRGTLIRGAKLGTALRRAASCPPAVRDAINAKLAPF